MSTPKITFCVPTDLQPADKDGHFWESPETQFSWWRDSRVMLGPSRTPTQVVVSGRVLTGVAEDSGDPRYRESIDEEPAMVSVFQNKSFFYVRADFRNKDLGLAFNGKTSEKYGIDVLLAVLRSLRFNR